MLPFRSHLQTPRLREGYELLSDPELSAGELNELLDRCGEPGRSPEIWRRVLARSTWYLAVVRPDGRLVGFVRSTSDRALNANLWDLLSDPQDPARAEVITALVRTALGRLRRELGGCSISLSAPPEALEALTRAGFVVDPGGIRAMGLGLDPGPGD
ncbi:MAG: N-acetyltransferase [Synechococcaceae cyanobacterium]|nr:N-acetyltransferase [Synechococcaceae cyanobacterium]